MDPASPAVDFHRLAIETMVKNGFDPVFSAAVGEQVAHLSHSVVRYDPSSGIRNLRDLLWSSIDNDTSRDLDQIEVVEQMPSGEWKVLIGIADVDALVPKHCPIDDHAAAQTTSVYSGLEMFPMLPQQLSTAATSLLENEDRFSVVIEFLVTEAGDVDTPSCYRAVVRNKAQLAYGAVGGWLEGKAEAPAKVNDSPDLQTQLKQQSAIAETLRKARFQRGALDLDSTETQPVIVDGQVVGLSKHESNPATQLIEDFMIAANESMAKLLEAAKFSSLRRVVRTPERWSRIVELAAGRGEKLPLEPDSAALNAFLTKERSSDPEHFADLSLAVVKLMGAGEYVLQRIGDAEMGHFGLAVQDYTHSTAPNRRFADLVTQRLMKAALAKTPTPYTDEELTAIAKQCTEREGAARKVEREMSKRIAAVAMQHRIGERFDAIVTGVTQHGTFARVLEPHCEGLVVRGQQGLDVGDKIRVRLVSVDVARGYIDFAKE